MATGTGLVSSQPVSPSALLDSYYRRPDLIGRLEIGPSGKIAPSIIDWWDYWRPIQLLGRGDLVDANAALRTAWEKYVRSGFNETLARAYCFKYFALLALLATARREQANSRLLEDALRAAVAFECAGVTDYRHPTDFLAAAASTSRHPAYLLTRLKWPDIPHSTRFLPVMVLSRGAPSTFGHYRRYSLSNEDDHSLLVHPLNKAGGNGQSVEATATLGNTLGSSSDRFVADRARRAWQHTILPLLQQTDLPVTSSMFDFVDVGGGTGALAGALWNTYSNGHGRATRCLASAWFWWTLAEPPSSKSY